LSVLGVLIVLGGLTGIQTVTSQLPTTGKFDVSLGQERDLSGYSTFAWSKSQEAIENLANHLRIINAVQKEMKELGYRIDTVRPEVLIQYRVERSTGVSTRTTQQPSAWDPTDLRVQIDVSKEQHISLSVELVEAETGFMLWQAKGTYPLGTPDRAERQINSAITDLFAKYPRKENGK
jgi:hypothetical protein